MSKKGYLPYLAGTMMSLIFGLSFLFIKEGLEVFTAIELLAYRFTLACVVLTALAATKVIKINLKGKPIRLLVILAVFEPICYFACETIGIQLTSVTEAGLFVAMIPVVVAILAYFILKEKPLKQQVVFIVASVFGAMFIVAMEGNFDGNGNPIGILFLVGAVFSAGGYTIMSRKSSKIFSPIEITFVMMWIAAIFFNTLNVIEIVNRGTIGSLHEILTFRGAMTLFYLGVMSSVGAYFMLNYILSRLSAASASVFTQLATVVAVVSGVTLGKETLHWYQVVGGMLILAGVFGTSYYENKRKEQGTEALSDAEEHIETAGEGEVREDGKG